MTHARVTIRALTSLVLVAAEFRREVGDHPVGVTLPDQGDITLSFSRLQDG